jgi:hypothetical protein
MTASKHRGQRRRGVHRRPFCRAVHKSAQWQTRSTYLKADWRTSSRRRPEHGCRMRFGSRRRASLRQAFSVLSRTLRKGRALPTRRCALNALSRSAETPPRDAIDALDHSRHSLRQAVAASRRRDFAASVASSIAIGSDRLLYGRLSRLWSDCRYDRRLPAVVADN